MVVNLSLAKTIKWGQFLALFAFTDVGGNMKMQLSIEYNNSIDMILALAPNGQKNYYKRYLGTYKVQQRHAKLVTSVGIQQQPQKQKTSIHSILPFTLTTKRVGSAQCLN